MDFIKSAAAGKIRQLSQFKDQVMNVPEIERKVKEATNDESWGPSGQLMNEIAEATRDFDERNMIIRVLTQRLKPEDPSKWRYAYKALLLVEHLLRNGDEIFIGEIQSLQHSYLKPLKSFAFVDPSNQKDHGLSVRERAKKVIDLLTDEESLTSEREKAATNRNKYQGLSAEAYSSVSHKSAAPTPPTTLSKPSSISSAPAPVATNIMSNSSTTSLTFTTPPAKKAVRAASGGKPFNSLDNFSSHAVEVPPVYNAPAPAPAPAPKKSADLDDLFGGSDPFTAPQAATPAPATGFAEWADFGSATTAPNVTAAQKNSLPQGNGNEAGWASFDEPPAAKTTLISPSSDSSSCCAHNTSNSDWDAFGPSAPSPAPAAAADFGDFDAFVSPTTTTQTDPHQRNPVSGKSSLFSDATLASQFDAFSLGPSSGGTTATTAKSSQLSLKDLAAVNNLNTSPHQPPPLAGPPPIPMYQQQQSTDMWGFGQNPTAFSPTPQGFGQFPPQHAAGYGQNFNFQGGMGGGAGFSSPQQTQGGFGFGFGASPAPPTAAAAKDDWPF